MKPTLQFHEVSSRGDSRPSRRQSAAPKTDYNFQESVPGDFSGSRGGGNRKGSFRSISQDYFSQDARSTFACEAALFGVLVMIVAGPVIDGARGLLQFVNATGVL